MIDSTIGNRIITSTAAMKTGEVRKRKGTNRSLISTSSSLFALPPVRPA